MLVLALPNLDRQELRLDLGNEYMLSPFLAEASGGQHRPALIVHSRWRVGKNLPTYVSWTSRRESWLPAFALDRHYEQDRESSGRIEQ